MVWAVSVVLAAAVTVPVLFAYAAGGELDGALVTDELLAAAAHVGLPEGEVRSSIQSGLHAVAREPRRRPPTIGAVRH